MSQQQQATRVVLRNKGLSKLDADTLSKVGLTSLDLSNNQFEELPKEIERFTSMTMLRVFCNRLRGLPAALAACTALASVDLGKNELATLPTVLCALRSLREIDANWNRISALPAEICQLAGCLRNLVLNVNRLAELPESFGRLSALESLDLSINDFRVFPAPVAQLAALTSLNLAGNELTSIPASIARLGPTLTKLDLRSNRLVSLPEELGELVKLTTLLLQHNNLQQLPASIGRLELLRELNVSENRLRALPAGVFGLKQLRKLLGWQNAIETLADDMSELQALTEIDFTKNSIRTIHPSLATLSQLKIVRFGSNSLTEYPRLPPGVSEFFAGDNRISGPLVSDVAKGLEIRQLSLCRNGITALPRDIGAMSKELRILDLSFNNLSTLPAEIGQLTVLMTLNLAVNQLETLPATIGQLRQLQVLICGYNKLSTLPAEIGTLPSLQTLHLGGNAFSRIPPAITGIASLRVLMLANNTITALPSDLSGLSKLESLDLSSNQIADFQPVCSLVSLVELSLSHNKITRIPRGISALARLTDFYLSGNQITELPQELESMRSLRQLVASHNELHFAHAPDIPRYATFDGDTAGRWWRLEGNTEIDRNTIEPSIRSAHLLSAGGSTGAPAVAANSVSGISVSFGWSEMCGRRPDMQDTMCVVSNFQQVPWCHVAAVFDGHSGTVTSQYAAKRFHVILASMLNREPAEAALKQAFRTLHNEMCMRKFTDGTAAVAVLIQGSKMVVSNIGDSRAVISYHGTACDLTEDCKPERQTERERIKTAGGFVSVTGRVNGELALTRALGDCSMQPYVTWEPETVVRTIGPDVEFAILACDGIWDVLTSQQAVDIVRRVGDPVRAAATLRDHAYSLGSGDNLSVIVLRFAFGRQ